jgi:hypothetical protein
VEHRLFVEIGMVHRTAYKRTFEAMCQHSLDEFAGSAGHKFTTGTWIPLSIGGQRRAEAQPACGRVNRRLEGFDED